MKMRKKSSPRQTQRKNLIAKFKKLPLWVQIIAPICFGAILIFGVVNFYEFGRQKEWWGYSDRARYLIQHEIFRWDNENLKTKIVKHPPVQGLLGVISRMSQKEGMHSDIDLYPKKSKMNSLYSDFIEYLKKSSWNIEQSDMLIIKASKTEGKFNLKIEITTYDYDDNPYISCEIYI